MIEARYRCERAGEQHAASLLSLFEGAGSGCYCNYWYFQGDKNAWLERCYVKPELNRAALVARLAAPELCGVVALGLGAESDRLCGWLNISRQTTLARLYEQRVYKNLPCFQADPRARENVYAVACLYVAEPERGRGAAKALLDAAILAARDAGGTAIEAFPRSAPTGEKLRADQVWTGPEHLFHAAGFEAVSDFRPYPVLRLTLS